MITPMAIEQRASLSELMADESRFRAWYDDALPRVYRYLLTRCGDDALAEEVAQEVFVEAVRRPDRYRGRSDIVTWLCAIARHRLVDAYRRRGREERRERQLMDGQRAYGDPAWRASSPRESVAAALSQLTHDERLALLFRHLDGLSVREVAGVLGRSEKATESLLARARAAFREGYGGRTDA